MCIEEPLIARRTRGIVCEAYVTKVDYAKRYMYLSEAIFKRVVADKVLNQN